MAGRIAGVVNKALNRNIVARSRRQPSQDTIPMIPLSDVINAMTTFSGLTQQQSDPLPRNPLDNNPFGPLFPLRPDPIDPNRPDTGRPEPRLSEYPVGWNLPGESYRAIPFQTLKDAARNIDILRRCIEIRKSHITGLQWTWRVSDDYVEAELAKRKGASRADLMSELNDKYATEIQRLNEFWKRPWKANNMSFRSWINMVLEEILVLDALAVYPRMTLGGEVLDFEIIDGATIKPLRDWRGALPMPPNPAYQQELWGFPRGEFTATTMDTEEGTIVPGAFMADQMYYFHHFQVPDSPYGYSPVEQALASARLYLNRQGWMLSEYDDGTMPLTWLVPEANGEQLTLTQRREWEAAVNDELAGNTANRYRIKITPKGFKPEQTKTIDSQFKPDYDQHLITLMASHLDITMAELGFANSRGLGSQGYHEGEEDVQNRKATRPTCNMLQEIIEDLSRLFLKAPPELEFYFENLDSEDEAAMDAIDLSRVESARMTINEFRDRVGLPRFGFAEADMPMVQTGRGVIFIEGASAVAPPGTMIQPASQPEDQPQLQGGSTGANPAKPIGVAPPTATRPSQTPPGSVQNKPGQHKQPTETKSVEIDEGKAFEPSSGPNSVEKHVYQQMKRDFPDKALKWLPQAFWEGPVTVTTDQIDFSNVGSWAATKDDNLIDHYGKAIKRGEMKPVILVKSPTSEQYKVIDGHHRSLAARKIGRPVLAYIGRVGESTGPWYETHSFQKRNKTIKATETKAVVQETFDAEKSAEIGAYNRWKKRNARPGGRPFRFNYLSSAEAIERSVITFEELGVTAEFVYKES